jgi:hypothetical protein
MKIIGPSSAHLQEHPDKTLELYNRFIMLILKQKGGQLRNIAGYQITHCCLHPGAEIQNVGFENILQAKQNPTSKSNCFLVRSGGVTVSLFLNLVRPPL